MSLFSNKDLHFGKLLPFQEAVQEAWLNVSSGIMLMFANLSSMLLVGGAKMIIEWKWGTLIFGKTSFAFSVSNLIAEYPLYLYLYGELFNILSIVEYDPI